MTDVFVCSCCGLYYLNIYQYSIHKYILYIHVHFVNRSSPNFIRDRYHADKNNQEPPRLGGKSRGSHGRPILLRPEPRTWRMHHADAVYLGDGRWTDSRVFTFKVFFFEEWSEDMDTQTSWIHYNRDTVPFLDLQWLWYSDLMRVCLHSWTLRGVQVHSFWTWWHPQTHFKQRNASNLGYLFLSKSCFEMHDLQIQFATEPSNLHGAMTAPKPMSCVCFPN